MQVHGHIAESSSNYREPQRYPTLRGVVQSVCIHVHVELGKSLCDAAGYLEILCAPYAVLNESILWLRERHRCYC